MGAQNGTGSSASSGGGGNNNNNNNNNQATQMAQNVKKKLGLVEKKYGPMSYLQSGPTTGYYASAYAGTPDADFYGEEASQFAKEEMQAAGMGTITPQGSFQNVIKGKDGKMQIVSGAGAMMGTGMGTGEQTVMGQIPISKAMFEQQKKIQMMALAPLSLMAPFPVSTALGLAANKVRKAQYNNYVNTFNQGFIKPTSSYGITSSQSTQASSLDSGNAQYAGQTQEIAAETERQKKLALSRKAVEAAAKRTFFGGKTRVIEGKMVGGL